MDGGFLWDTCTSAGAETDTGTGMSGSWYGNGFGNGDVGQLVQQWERWRWHGNVGAGTEMGT